jgi:tetratricopeptide (TPR) repeat protein
MKRFLVVACLVLLAACVRPPEPRRRLGKVDFETSCNDEAQSRFDTGLALLHHMMYDEAQKNFYAATAMDEHCAMAYWGMAMTRLHPLSAGRPDGAALGKSVGDLGRARAMESTTLREQTYIEALATFFAEWDRIDHASRLVAWEAAQKKLYDAYPDDTDAAAFYALAHIATAPAADLNYHHHKTAAKILESLHASNPEHPGALHYLVRAYDNPELAGRGEDVAKAYAELAPKVPQAQHAPSHIFVRTGEWDDTIEYNARAMAEARRMTVAGGMSYQFVHAADFQMYAYLQGGWDRRGESILRQFARVERFQDDFASAYGLAAAPARYHLERMDWTGAAQLPVGNPTDFPWEKYPAARALTHFARGIGAARSGDPDGARVAAGELDAIHAELAEAEPYWAFLVDARRKAVEAWIAHAEGRDDEALEQMRAAADLEDRVDKHPVTPGPPLPLRELLGDLLLELDRPAEAYAEFRRSLALAPNRLYAVYKSARSADKADDKVNAHTFYSQFLKLVEASHSDRREVKKAKYFLRVNPTVDSGG